MTVHVRSAWMWLVALAGVFLAGVSMAGCECGVPIGNGEGDGGADARRPGARTDECGNGLDDDENGLIDDFCPCAPGETQRCFSGGLASNEVGACASGTQTCVASGSEWGDWGDSDCDGEVLPATEACDGSDADCDGAVDEGCPCTDGESRACGEEFLIAPCMAGTQSCRGGSWSGCEGAVGPTADVCTDTIDNDCDGLVNELCACVPGPEVCRDGADNDCDGLTDEMECTPDWPRDAGVPLDASTDTAIPSSPTCSELRDATGGDWTLTAVPMADGTAPGASLLVSRVAVDDAGNVFVLGQVCDGIASVAGVSVSSYAVVDYPLSTCNVFMVSVTSSGALRYAWSPVLADLVPPPARSVGGPSSHAEGLAPDGLGGVWIAGGFRAGTIELAPGRVFAEEVDWRGLDGGGDAFLVHLDSFGSVDQTVVVGESGTEEVFRDVALTREGAPVVLGSSASPVFAFGGTLVRSAGGVFVARVLPSGEPGFVNIARATGGLDAGRLSRDSAGHIVLTGGSRGALSLGSTSFVPMSDTTQQLWLWTVAEGDGATLLLRSWEALEGYPSIADAHVDDAFSGFAGLLRGTLSVEGGSLSTGADRPEFPESPFVVGLPAAGGEPSMMRALVPFPFDVYHGVRARFGWNVCHETMAVAEGDSTTAPLTQVDFGAGLVAVPEGRVHLVQWSGRGDLVLHREIPVAIGSEDTMIRDAAWSPVERSVVVGLVHRTGFTATMSVRRFAFR